MLPYRVLDLSDERGQLCGRLLADLGADVILVEPPGGSSSRRVGPFAGDVIDPEGSLFHWAFNRGKRSAVLDLDDAADREVLLGAHPHRRRPGGLLGPRPAVRPRPRA